MTCFARTLRTLRSASIPRTPTRFHESISQPPCAARTRAQRRHPGMDHGSERGTRPSASEAAVDDGSASGAPGMDRESTDTVQNGSAESADPSGFKIESDSDGQIITVEDGDVTDAILRDGAFEGGEVVGCAGWQ